MILNKMLDLYKNIDDYRVDMYELAKGKGFSYSEVIRISQKLDREIIILQ